MIKFFIKKVTEGENLSQNEASNLIKLFVEDETTQAQAGSILTALKMKGETIDELTGFASKLIELAPEIKFENKKNIVDSCGTGGDGTNTFNISTTAAILASACGITVAKHSNFGYTSICGSSNVIEALGLSLLRTPEDVEKSINKNNIAFLHAPYFHTSTKFVVPIRKELGIRTFFNYIGPLTNPVRPTGQVLGVANIEYAKKLSQVLLNLGCKKAMVVCGENPTIDEISLCGKTRIYKLENGKIEYFELFPEDIGLKTVSLECLKGGNPEENAKITEKVLSGTASEAQINAVLINTAAMLWAGNCTNSLESGFKTAKENIENGKAMEKIIRLRKYEK